MRNIILLNLMILSIWGCSPNAKQNGKKVISVSILPQKYFVERIAGDDFDVNVLIPPGASPATYEPTPRQMKEFSRSVIYFRVGHIPFEEAWLEKLTSGANDIKVVDLSQGFELLRGPSYVHGNHVHQGGVDPHIWTSPSAVRHMTGGILKELIAESPQKKNLYEKNYKLFLNDISVLDHMAHKAFSGVKNRCFMIYHPAMSYFARDYDLTQIPIELEGKDPSPMHMKQVISQAQQMGIRVIFVQKQFSDENARAVAREIDGQVQSIDPLSEDWLKEMHRIVSVFSSSLNH